MQEATLPPLRDDLTLHRGPVDQDGAPTWTLLDPLRNRFFRLGWPAFEMLARWHLGDPSAVAEAVSRETTLSVEPQEVAALAEFLARGQLLKPAGPGDTKRLLAIAEASKPSWATWLLHHYLFFRIPLVRPDAALGRALPMLAWMGGRGFRIATVVALLAGLALVGRQWTAFTTTLVDHFSMAGLAAFGITLALAKVIHELGHAFTAKSFGCRVPTMGVAFLVMWPVLYTDVNEAWKLTSRRRRLLIGGAGILAELALAAWATLAWALLPPGAAREMAFTLAATTWVSSLAINLSPFMRFDGYFLLSDALGLPNLHARAFDLARWWLREALFGLGDPAPEYFPPHRRAFLVAFAIGVWIYRLVLFLGIAVLVYHFFIKVVGVVLFVVEIGWFVVKPIAMEMQEWRARGARIAASRRAHLTFGLLGVVLLSTAIPWSGRVTAPAMLKAGRHAAIYAPAPAVLDAVTVAEGQVVPAGTVVALLASPDLDQGLAQVGRRITVLRYELAAISFDDGFRGRSQALAKELDAALAERAALDREKARLTLAAPIDGMVVDVSPHLQPGQWIGVREPLLSVRGTGAAAVEAYVSEDNLPRIATGMTATFVAEGGGAAVAAVVEAIDRAAVRSLGEPALATPFGGAIAARIDRQALVPDGALYRVRLAVADPTLAVPVALRGEVRIDGDGRSPLAGAFRAAAAVIVREWGM